MVRARNYDMWPALMTFTPLNMPVQAGGCSLNSVQDAVDHVFRWEDADVGIVCHPSKLMIDHKNDELQMRRRSS